MSVVRVRVQPRPRGNFVVVKVEDGATYVMGTGGYREEAVFASRRSAWTAYRMREERGISSWVLQPSPFDGLPTVGAGRPCSMFGGMTAAGTATGRISSAQTSYAQIPGSTPGRYEDWRDVVDPMPPHALVLAFRAGMDGLGFEANEEAITAGVPVLAFQYPH